jgi:uncharacterized protein YebE (UPF0316 family)
METVLLFDRFYVPGYLVPVLIFTARILDVSMGTLRIIMVGRGLRTVSSLLGFMEVFIWLLAISQVLQHLHGLTHYLAYSAGFASGTFIGMTIEKRLTYGLYLVRIIVPLNENGIVERLIQSKYKLTHMIADGISGPVEVILSVVKRRELPDILDIVKKHRPKAFYTVEDVRTIQDYRPISFRGSKYRELLQPFYWFRKSK